MLRQTPRIKRHKDSLQEFEEHVAGCFGHRFSLNRTNPKYRHGAWAVNEPSRTKGVDADLIIIFSTGRGYLGKPFRNEPDQRNIQDSFAFSFNWVSEDSDELTVSFSTKIDGLISYSQRFSPDVFQELLRGINRKFRDEGNPKSRATLLWRLHGVFMDNEAYGISPFDESEALDQALGKEKDEILGLKQKIQSADERCMEAHEAVSRIRQIVNQEASTSAEALEIKRLENEIKTVKQKMTRKINSAFKKKGGDAFAKQESDAASDAKKAREKLSASIKRVYAKMPSDTASKKTVQRWLEDNS